MYGKPLAYIVKIKDIREIPGADNVELATVLDYTVVVKKNKYKPDDLCLYIEADSVLPDGFTAIQRQLYDSIKDGSYFKGIVPTIEEIKLAKEDLAKSSKYPYFEFLRDKNFKIKNMKLNKFGVVSQGILFSLSDVGLDNTVKVGQDFTKQFNITEIIQDNEEAGLTTKQESVLSRFLTRFSFYRKWRKRHNTAEIWDETFPEKSDEENVQKIYSEMFEKYADKEWVATEKLEGLNISIYSEEIKGLFGRKTKRIGVCSRTRELNKTGNGSAFWKTVIRLRLDDKIKNIPGEWWCRGEHVGPKIQNNIYKLNRTDVVFFDFYKKVHDKIDKKKFKWVKLNFEESVKFAKENNLQFVPILNEHYKLPVDSVNEQGVKVSGADIMLKQSDKNTVFGNNLEHKREGFVLRLRDDYNVSFKVKNPNYSYAN